MSNDKRKVLIYSPVGVPKPMIKVMIHELTGHFIGMDVIFNKDDRYEPQPGLVKNVSLGMMYIFQAGTKFEITEIVDDGAPFDLYRELVGNEFAEDAFNDKLGKRLNDVVVGGLCRMVDKSPSLPAASFTYLGLCEDPHAYVKMLQNWDDARQDGTAAINPRMSAVLDQCAHLLKSYADKEGEFYDNVPGEWLDLAWNYADERGMTAANQIAEFMEKNGRKAK